MSSLPTGTVTFLFTDIEGSTRLWEGAPDAMSRALSRHDILMREAIESQGGHVFKTVGDGFCAAFATAAAAVAAALSAQRFFHAELWGKSEPIKVRMALHTGAAEVRDSDYFGPPLNRVARLLSVGHGGQVLLSLVTEELVRDKLPGGVELLDLGKHRLKDLERPERIFQVVASDLPAGFPPLHSLEEQSNNLPVQLTSFVGREKEMAEVERLLNTTRLLTLTGSGGCGKTRLALQVGANLLDEYPDGVWLVDLTPLTDPVLVPQSAALPFGLREEPNRPLQTVLIDYLRSKHLLLLLDNCEQLVDACAQLVDALLKACPGLRILATSREALGIAGEVRWRVPSLSSPEPGHVPALESLTQYEAVRLFIQRARAVKTEFTVTNANAPAVAQICHRLGGIPFAIELAAARVTMFSAEQICARLDNLFRLLTGGDRTKLPRQQTLRALIDWSYDLLSEPEHKLFRRLSVFAGGWTIEAAEIVCSGDGVEKSDIMELLTHLIDKSLVVAEEEDTETRYRMLETMRQYAQEKFAESGEVCQTQRHHLDWCVAFASRAETKLRGPEQLMWLDRLEIEHDNWRAALDWAAETGDAQQGLRLAEALWRFWGIRGYATERRERMVRLLALPAAAARTAPRAHAVSIMAMCLDPDQARSQLEESIAIQREVDDKSGLAESILNLGCVMALGQGDVSKGIALIKESRELFSKSGNKWGVAAAIRQLGYAALRQGDNPQARALAEQSLTLSREVGDTSELSETLELLGSVAFRQDEYLTARALLSEVAELNRKLKNLRAVGGAVSRLADVAAEQGAFTEARAFREQVLGIHRELGDKVAEAASLRALGDIASMERQEAAAIDFYEKGLKIVRDSGVKQAIAQYLHDIGWAALDWYDMVGAQSRMEESLAIYRGLGDRNGMALMLHRLGFVAHYQRDYPRAQSLYEESLAIYQQIGLKSSVNWMGLGLGELAFSRGRLEQAQSLFEEGLALSRETTDTLWGVLCKRGLGYLACVHGDLSQAFALFAECLVAFHGLFYDDKRMIAECLPGFAKVAHKQGNAQRAARLYGAAGAIHDVIGPRLAPIESSTHDRDLAEVRSALGETAFGVAWAEGRAMTLKQAIAYALEKPLSE